MRQTNEKEGTAKQSNKDFPHFKYFLTRLPVDEQISGDVPCSVDNILIRTYRKTLTAQKKKTVKSLKSKKTLN